MHPEIGMQIQRLTIVVVGVHVIAFGHVAAGLLELLGLEGARVQDEVRRSSHGHHRQESGQDAEQTSRGFATLVDFRHAGIIRGIPIGSKPGAVTRAGEARRKNGTREENAHGESHGRAPGVSQGHR